MKKLALMIAALATIVIAAPSVADAQTVVIKRGGHHQGYGHRGHSARADMHRGRGHRGHGSKVVVIKRHRY